MSDLRKYICAHIRKGDAQKIFYDIENGRIRPSKSLQDAITKMLEGKPEFRLIDDQMVVYETICDAAEKSQADGKKRTRIVEEGPGMGKTVAAVNLLSARTNKGQYVFYTSKNSAPRNVYLEKLTEGGFKRALSKECSEDRGLLSMRGTVR